MLTDKLNFFIGYDSKEDIAYRVCKFSILNNTFVEVQVIDPVRGNDIACSGKIAEDLK